MEIRTTLKVGFEGLLKALDLSPLPVPGFSGDEAAAPSRLRLAASSALSMGMAAVLAGEIWRLRGGERQSVTVGLEAAAAATRCVQSLRFNGAPVTPPFADHPLTGFFQCADGGWLHLHGGFTGRSRLLDLINAANDSNAVMEGVAKWNGTALEDAIAYMNLCGALVRSRETWLDSTPGEAHAPVQVHKIGEAPPLLLEAGAHPLDGVHVIDAGHGLAGPLAAMHLGAFGAEVLAVRSPLAREPLCHALAAGANKRHCVLDFAKPADAEAMRRAVRDADIFIDSHRPGALGKFGFTREALAHNAPGLIHVEISAYGPSGPWAGRRGFESDVQAATGIAAEQGQFLAASRNRRAGLPALVDADICSVLAGQLAAAGAAAALLRRMREGGSWAVTVSLAGAAVWLQALGRLETKAVPGNWALDDGDFAQCQGAGGVWSCLQQAVSLDKTPLLWQPPSLDRIEKEARFSSTRNDAYAA